MQNSSLVVQGGGSAVALPLLGEGGLLGVVVLAHPEEEHFDSESLPFLGLLASQVSLAVHNARAYLYSEEVAIVEERARIAREIHDGEIGRASCRERGRSSAGRGALKEKGSERNGAQGAGT